MDFYELLANEDGTIDLEVAKTELLAFMQEVLQQPFSEDSLSAIARTRANIEINFPKE
jgi:hypothetical protein